MSRHRPLQRGGKRGAAVVELAVCMPILVLFVLGTIETSNMIFLKQVLTHASYEAAKVASHPNAQNSEPATRANAVLTARNIHSGTVVVAPTNIEGLARGNKIEVTVSAPADANSLVPFSHFASKTLSVSMTSVKN